MGKTIEKGRKLGSGRIKGSCGGVRAMEAILMLTLKAGDSFYTEKQDKDMTSMSNYYKAKITTERLCVIDAIKETLTKITKVTIIQPAEQVSDTEI